MPSSPPRSQDSKTGLSDQQQEQAELRYSMLRKTVLENKYIKQVPTPKQALFLSLPEYREGFYGGAGGGGKALALSTPIPTPLGWVKMLDIVPGDKVLDENGLPCNVTAVSEIFTDNTCYEITLNTGEKLVADSGHEWYANHASAYVDFDATGRFDASAMDRTSKWIEHSHLLKTYQLHQVFAATRLENKQRMDPICLLTRPQKDWSEAESWFGNLLDSNADPMKSPLQSGREYGKMARRIRRTDPRKNRNISVPFPQQVFYWPSAARAAFAQGILEEATFSPSVVMVFLPLRTTKDAQCMSDLLRSVGINCEIRKARETRRQPGACDLWLSIYSCANLGVSPIWKEHPAVAKDEGYRQFVRITDIKRIESVPVRCISVDSLSRCYLAGRSMVATHNSSALLMGALQFVHVPGYAALIIRRTFRDLNQPSALIPRSHEWLSNTDAKWDAQNVRWRFPSGATVGFGYIEHDRDVYQYQGAELQYIGWDELTQFSPFPYTFMFSRTRRLEGVDIPIRVRGASNPGNKYAAWVKDRFITNRTTDRFFIPATVYDNPHLDIEEYKRSLMEMDPVNRERILNGDWDVSEEGTIFQKHWFNTISATEIPSFAQMRLVRSWDLAATEPSESNPDPDWTVGALMGRHLKTGEIFVIDVKNVRKNAGAVKRLIGDTARADGRDVKIIVEQEPGSAGKSIIADLVGSLPGFDLRGKRPTGDKIQRAVPLAAAAEAGIASMLMAPWREFALQQLGVFGSGVGHDDAVDALSNGFMELAGGARPWTPGDFKRLFSPQRKEANLSPAQLLQQKYGFGRALQLPPPTR